MDYHVFITTVQSHDLDAVVRLANDRLANLPYYADDNMPRVVVQENDNIYYAVIQYTAQKETIEWD